MAIPTPIHSLAHRPSRIPALLATFHPSGFQPTIDNSHFTGSHCRVYRAVFPDGSSWAVRIPLPSAGSQQSICKMVKEEAELLSYLELMGFQWSPRVKGSCLTFENEVGWPFVALEWIEGESLASLKKWPSLRVRKRIFGQLAEIMVALIHCTRNGGGDSSTFCKRLIENKITRVRRGMDTEISEQDCFDQRSLLGQVLHPLLEEAPFAINHGDIKPSNIIIDAKLNIAGIIDWGVAGRRPMQYAGAFPRLLRPPELDAPLSKKFRRDRALFRAALLDQERQEYQDVSEAVAYMDFITAARDVDFRTFYLESLINTGRRADLVQRGWKLDCFPLAGDVAVSAPSAEVSNSWKKISNWCRNLIR
ncbi:MAG: hypothetical protein M1814_002988 [Vezdaea aestivalis]|nr:MAG: hypothetical protein M1814_002988 [Vezdaea aestivalis]